MKRILYHTGYQEIREPDVHFGRKNADFGQGFYMTKDPEFAKRWARERRGRETVVNQLELGAEMDMVAEENEAAWITDEHVENHKR